MAYCRFWVKKTLKNAPKTGENSNYFACFVYYTAKIKKSKAETKKNFSFLTKTIQSKPRFLAKIFTYYFVEILDRRFALAVFCLVKKIKNFSL